MYVFMLQSHVKSKLQQAEEDWNHQILQGWEQLGASPEPLATPEAANATYYLTQRPQFCLSFCLLLLLSKTMPALHMASLCLIFQRERQHIILFVGFFLSFYRAMHTQNIASLFHLIDWHEFMLAVGSG